MDLKSGYPFWAIRNGLARPRPALDADLDCDVAVVGGGITGALIADELARHGHAVAVLEKRDLGWGSTSASTALLQYEIDTHLVDLARRYGQADAVLAYRACVDAIDWLHERAAGLGRVPFSPCRSLYYASRRRHVRGLREEFAARLRHGIEVEWWEAGDIQAAYGFRAPAAILSRQAAQVDPYRMTLALLQRLARGGTPVHDHEEIAELRATSRRAVLRTVSGFRVRAGHVVLACGYESQRWLRKRVARNRSSYAFVSDPLPPQALGGLVDSLVWETARPYLYLRTTPDHRLLVGGQDDAVDLPARRDARVMAKARKLAARAQELFPHLPLRPAFAWAGTFAETEDGLPWFGTHPQWGPRVLFAMAYGGNGITYSALGAGLLRATLERRPHPLKALFSFGRGR
ncbi:amino acid oxidase [Pseudoxanthomonas broegbernensis]|uniref:Amino acid oxidase n=1 Tax=Pseudoxanthomonas broegbernensis TaxID=83619 RepID=A0A7V8GLQ3_9GAMM|nr:FAD-dependent oxidoreductase [Pseudoxanthomonas broegbernensis]KAF1686010.1 amino acid oxidase [Pseudoxanthomonas broegbernensis]MBB6063734.1 glycine/D-amino acid oxidase-like deaminating enzyme [Pseudoxanthomonas broegbernensis]